MIRDDSPDLFNQPASVTVRPTRAKRATNSLVEIPFMQRPTCTIKEACKASGMGRTKFYELIKNGTLAEQHSGPAALGSRPLPTEEHQVQRHVGLVATSRLDIIVKSLYFDPQ